MVNIKIMTVAIVAPVLAGCSGSRFDRDVASGAVIGGVAGGIVGGAARRSVGGAVAGGVIGLVAGGIIAGALSPNRRCYVRTAPGRWRRARCY